MDLLLTGVEGVMVIDGGSASGLMLAGGGVVEVGA